MAKRILHKAYVRVLTWLGVAIDIHSKGKWPSNVLSNFYPHRFKFDGVWCRSMEGFLQSLKTPSLVVQKTFVNVLAAEQSEADNLNSFLEGQRTPFTDYELALNEVTNGRKIFSSILFSEKG